MNFSADMVRAILAGRKTQTRRIVKCTPCPYGDVGDKLWVREIFCPKGDEDGRIIDDQYWYLASNPDVQALNEDGGIKINKDGRDASPWRSCARMPRKASRILLEITSVRVERLKDISEEEAMAEGVLFNGDYDLWWDYQCQELGCLSAIDSFWSLFCKIYDQKTWNENPWVWVITFKTLTTTKGRVDE